MKKLMAGLVVMGMILVATPSNVGAETKASVGEIEQKIEEIKDQESLQAEVNGMSYNALVKIDEVYEEAGTLTEDEKQHQDRVKTRIAVIDKENEETQSFLNWLAVLGIGAIVAMLTLIIGVLFVEPDKKDSPE